MTLGAGTVTSIGNMLINNYFGSETAKIIISFLIPFYFKFYLNFYLVSIRFLSPFLSRFYLIFMTIFLCSLLFVSHPKIIFISIPSYPYDYLFIPSMIFVSDPKITRPQNHKITTTITTKSLLYFRQYLYYNVKDNNC